MSEKKLKRTYGDKPPFSVPEGYFKQFPERLHARMEGQVKQKKPARTVSFRQVIRPQLSLAAAILGFALIAYFTVRFFTGKTEQPEYTDLVQAVEYYLDDYALNDLVEEMPRELIEEEESNVYESEIMDYLLKEDIPTTTILDEE